MDSQQLDLYRRIQVFSFDQEGAQLSFSKRLAKDNSWSLVYTRRVIDEYKKFTFLAVAAGHPVSPSDQVDQVWHLHLSYTRSYWQEFCPKILQTPLHHEPTRGGSSEQLKFDKWYSQTLESYEQFFGEAPPIDIWPSPKIRFGQDLHFVRINVQENWVLPKLDWKTLFKIRPRRVEMLPLLFVFSFAVTSCQVVSGFPNPINLTGPEFLTFYILIGIVGIALASSLRFELRLPSNAISRRFNNLSNYEVAFLAGGKSQMIGTAIISLEQQGYIEVVTKQLDVTVYTWEKLVPKKNTAYTWEKLVLKKTFDNICDPVEKLVAQDIVAVDGAIKRVFQMSSIEYGIRDRLQKLGLVLSDNQSLKAQIYPSLIMLSLLGIGLLKVFVGISRDKPVGFLLMCMVVLLIFGIRFFVKPYRSRYGDRVLNDLIARSQKLKKANSSDSQFPLAFALFGGIALASDKSWIPPDQTFRFNRLTSSSSGRDGGYGGECDGGGGGCGGGGCGGCGGCGG